MFRGGLLADWYVDWAASPLVHVFNLHSSVAEQMPIDVQAAEEKFDLSLIATLEIDVVPHLGNARVPEQLVVCANVLVIAVYSNPSL